jgi:hypothetical protein
MTAAERQRKRRARLAAERPPQHDPRDDEMSRLQAEVARLQSEVERLARVGHMPSEMPGAADIVSRKFCRWFEAAIVEGRMSPLAVSLIGENLRHMAEVYWGRGGKRYPRKPKRLFGGE